MGIAIELLPPGGVYPAARPPLTSALKASRSIAHALATVVTMLMIEAVGNARSFRPGLHSVEII